MGMKIFWTNFAKSELKSIFDYYHKEVSLPVADRVVTGIVESTLVLADNSNIGQKEELLIDREQEFRYIVHKNYKIIYWLNREKSQVEIVDVFDTRQNPIKIKRTQ